MPPLHTKEIGGGHESPITAFILSPFLPPGEHVMDAASEHPCLQPSDSLPKLMEEGESPLPAYMFPLCPGLPIYFPDALPLSLC